MAYTYAQFQTALASEMIIPNNNTADANFQLILPTIIDYAEERCYRDLDLLYATNAQTLLMTSGSRKLDTSALTPYLYILEDLNVITPFSQTNPELGARNACTPVSKDWINTVYGNSSVTGTPKYFAMLDDVTILLGPFPDHAYTAEVVGKFLPTPLYAPASSAGTWLSIYLPGLFLAAAMVSASGYRHNFGAQADDPKMATSWEQQYQALLPSAKSEETRKKFQAWPAGGASESAPAQSQ